MDIAGYEDFSLVGAGGNAHVYSAAETDTGEIVAVKVLRGGGDETVSRRFARERDAMQKLKSLDYVAPVMESGVTEAGDPYLVMPLFDGGSLQQRVSAGPTPWREALILVRKVTEAIAQAHERRILHLDVKPANVLIDGDGEPYLADFGIAEAMGATASMSAQMMTPAYTPPERLNGAKPSEHTDVYGLGGLLFALLAGEAPFVLDEGMTPAAMIVAVLNEEVRIDRLADRVPPQVTSLVARTLSKQMDDRPQSADELGALIDEILEDDSIPAIDPVVAFRVGSEFPKSAAEPARSDGFPGEVEGSSTPAEIVSGSGEPIATGQNLPDGELLSVRPISTASRAGVRDTTPRIGLWVAAAVLFVCVGVLGAITATVWNGRDTPISGGDTTSLALDGVSGSDVFAGSPDELTSDVAGQQTSVAVAEDAALVDPDDDAASTGPSDGALAENAIDETTLVPVEVLGATEDDLTEAPSSTTTGADGQQGTTDTGVDAPVVVPVVASQINTVPDATPSPIPTPANPVAINNASANDVPGSSAVTDLGGDDSDASVPGTNTASPTAPAAPAPTPATTAPTTTAAPVLNEPLQFDERIDIGDIGETNVRLRFTTSVATGYTVTVRSNGAVAATQSGSAAAGASEGVTISGLTPGTDYTAQVTLNGPPSVTSTAVAFRTSGGTAAASTDTVQLQNLRVVSTQSTRFQVNYESNICANGSFVIREVGGGTVGSNAGQPDGCTTRHLAIPGFWTAALKPNTSYVITVTVEANGQGLGGGNTATQSITVTTSG